MGLLSIPLVDFLGKLIDRVVPDPQAKIDLQLELAKIADQADQRQSSEAVAQIQVNQTQAANPSLFVSGARPAFMWAGVAALVWEGMCYPLLGTIGVHPVHIPADYFDSILWFSAGLCGLRGFEKVKGVQRDTLTEQPKGPSIIKQVKKKLGGAWPF